MGIKDLRVHLEAALVEVLNTDSCGVWPHKIWPADGGVYCVGCQIGEQIQAALLELGALEVVLTKAKNKIADHIQKEM